MKNKNVYVAIIILILLIIFWFLFQSYPNGDVTVHYIINGEGSIVPEPTGTHLSSGWSYPYNTELTITAVPDPSTTYQFVEWTIYEEGSEGLFVQQSP